MDFGWTLADVVKRTRELKEQKAMKENAKLPLKLTEIEENGVSEEDAKDEAKENEEKQEIKDEEESLKIEEKENSVSSDGEPLMEIGMWSNEMANDIQTFSPEFENTFAQSCNAVGSEIRF